MLEELPGDDWRRLIIESLRNKDWWRGIAHSHGGLLVFAFNPGGAHATILEEVQRRHREEKSLTVSRIVPRACELFGRHFNVLLDVALERFPAIAVALAVQEVNPELGKKLLRDAFAITSKREWETRGWEAFHDPEPGEKLSEVFLQQMAKLPRGRRQKHEYGQALMEHYIGKVGGDRRGKAGRWTPAQRQQWCELVLELANIWRRFKRPGREPVERNMPPDLKRLALSKDRQRRRKRTPHALAFEQARRELGLSSVSPSQMEKYFLAEERRHKPK